MGERTMDNEGALTKMRGLLFGFSITRSIAVAAELGIADRLADGPRTATDLARECGDEHCLKILRNCRRRIPDKGKVLVVEIVLSNERNVPDTYRNFLDLGMLTQTEGGMERTESEFHKLLATAGFSLSRILPTKAPQWVMEALPQ